MTFKCNVNTGAMASFDKTNGILLFKSKSDEEEWRKAHFSKDEIVVEIDRFYWDKLKKRLKIAKQRVYICFDLGHDKQHPLMLMLWIAGYICLISEDRLKYIKSKIFLKKSYMMAGFTNYASPPP